MSDKKQSLLPAPAQAEDIPIFKGYTMEEIKYQRAMVALRKEFCKAKLMQSVADLRPKKKEGKNGNSKYSLFTSVASKVFSNLNLLDYAIMGVSLFGKVRKGLKLFKKKK